MYPAREALPYPDKTFPEAWKAATAYGTAVSDEALRQGLARTESELIRLRVSQLNGCLFCLDLHSRQSRQADITQQGAALPYAEALTVFDLSTFAEHHERLARFFDEKSVAEIAAVAVNLNDWTTLKLPQRECRCRTK